MEFTVTTQGQATVVAVTGSIDALTADEVTAFLAGQLRQGEMRLVFDMSRVDYISSAALRTILATLREARRLGGDLRLASIQPNVQKVLQVSGFTTILKVFPDVDAAGASFDASAGNA
jgi:anti-anti-sigma factor